MSGRLDTTPRGLLRLYFGIVMIAAVSVLTLHAVIGFLSGFGKQFGPYLLGLDALLLLLAYVGFEISSGGDEARPRKPNRGMLVVVGFVALVVCAETGGLSSPFFLLILMTAVFAGLTMPPRSAVLLTALLAAGHMLTTWLRPDEGLLLGGLDGVLYVVQTGKGMPIEELTGLCMHAVFLFLGMFLALRMARQFQKKVDSLTEHATRDPLTELPNRRGFNEKMRQEIQRAERYAWPISMLVIDLDHFKQVNDRHGHAFGDTVLNQSARLLRDAVGPVDHLARIGGEEFAVAAVAAEPNHGAELAQRILRHFREHPWDQLKPGLLVTCSIGVAVLDPSRTAIDPETSLAELLDRADQALYGVKQNGRNDFAVHGDERLSSGIIKIQPPPQPKV